MNVHVVVGITLNGSFMLLLLHLLLSPVHLIFSTTDGSYCVHVVDSVHLAMLGTVQ
jgi:hypothetical protein